jgi:hypothetical protein
MNKTVQFEREKETKNTVRFQEVVESGTPPVMNTLYLQKWFVGGAERITVTIDFDGGGADRI